MITYELAKQLKDGGFPQELNHRYCEHGFAVGVDTCKESAYYPTLSELIEACGDDIEMLVLEKSDEYLKKRHWRAYPTESAYEEKMKGDCVVDCCGYVSGSTPEEAVANLWLELNKK